MIIGHLPAGYILSKLSASRFAHSINRYRMYMFSGMFGSIAPDLDMFYFHLIDHRQTHHHKYFSHYPIVWLGLALIASVLCLSRASRKKLGIYALVFSASGFCHLILDTIVGDIWWFAPFIERPFSLATVPALLHPWWLNFIFHWSFLLELGVVAWAVWLWRRSPNPAVEGTLRDRATHRPSL